MALAFALALSTAAHSTAPEPFQHGLLWRLDRPGAAPSWVYGTLHSSDPRVIALPAPVASAFAAARTFAMEIYLSDVEEAEFLEASQFDDDRRLPPLLGEDAYARLQQVLGATAPSEEVLSRTKPWAALLRVAATRSSEEGNSPTLDRRLYLAARERHMSILGLEDLDEQVSAFDGIPQATQIALLKHALAHLPELEAQAEPTTRAWLAGDLAALARINSRIAGDDGELARHYAVLTRQLVENRSVLMAHRLFLPLTRGRVFVAVGALHLYGSKGLLALLRGQGYRVTRVY
jgi:uncharacterized protein YbaP (TraB family)